MKESKSLVHAIKSAQCLHTQNWPSSSMEEMSKCKSCLLERLIHSHTLNLSFGIWRLQSNGQKLYPNFQSCMAEECCDYIALFAF